MIRPLSAMASHKVADARSILVNEYPFWMVEIYSIPWYGCDDLPENAALAVSSNGVGLIREEDALSWEPHRFATEMLHEFLHIYGDSIPRSLALGMPELKYVHNLAQDLAINDWINRELPNRRGLRELPLWVLPQTFGFSPGLSYEEYFGLMVKDLKGLDSKLAAAGIQVSPAGEGNQPTVGSGFCNCGSSLADDLVRKAFSSTEIPQGERDDISKRPQTKLHELAADMITKAREAGHLNDSGKGSLGAMLGVSKVEPTIPWEVHLRNMLLRSFTYARGFKEYDWARPARRSPFGLIMPKMRSRNPSIIAAIDSSGSMYGRGLSEAAAEVSQIAKSIGFNLKAIFCDDAITNIVDVSGWESVASGAKGGGGTGFTEVFDYIAAVPSAERPRTLVFVTDGYVLASDVPAHCPAGLRVLWVITRGGQRPPCHWGDVVFVGEDVKVQ